jgi:nitroreductase/NAD-dependent dihydropyrimidine dehydrogenase PreA subunit
MLVKKESCIGCGICVKDCFPQDIEIIEGKAEIHNVTCMNCGHCIAVCPRNAVISDKLDMNMVKEYNQEEFSLDADHLLNFIKFRRTVRQFKAKEVPQDLILKIIEAGRFTQTGSNSQNVAYTVVEKELNKLKELTYVSLKDIGETMLRDPKMAGSPVLRYAGMWVRMLEDYHRDPKKNDRLFFNAPTVIVISAASVVDATLAASNMELMTNALGLGTFFSGFFVRAAQNNPELQQLLEIKEGHQISLCMIIGYPAVTYYRTVPRKEADISWK